MLTADTIIQSDALTAVTVPVRCVSCFRFIPARKAFDRLTSRARVRVPSPCFAECAVNVAPQCCCRRSEFWPP